MCLVACTQLSPAPPPELLIAAASDLAPAIPELTSELLQNQKITLRASIGSSGQLARQIEQGAPFDVFLSADEKFTEQLIQEGRAESSTLQIYAVGRLALWSKSGAVRQLADLTKPEIKRVAIANPAFAPYGRLAKEALQNAEIWQNVEPKIVLSETVRQTIQFAETGNVDATLTSWSLVHSRNGIQLPDAIRQSAVVIKGAKNAEAASRFLQFLQSSAGQGILGRHGLLPGTPPRDPLLQELKNNDSDGKSGGTDKQPQKSKSLRPAKKGNKYK